MVGSDEILTEKWGVNQSDQTLPNQQTVKHPFHSTLDEYHNPSVRIGKIRIIDYWKNAYMW